MKIPQGSCILSRLESAVQESGMEMSTVEGESPVHPGHSRSRTGLFQSSRVAWECCSKR